MNEQPNLTDDQLAAWEANAGSRRSTCRWPATPEWQSIYPSEKDCLQLAQLVEENSISTVYYRGLADEQVIKAILQGNPSAQIVVWDYWGYWSVGTDYDGPDDKTNADPTGPLWPWPKKQVVFQIEGTPHLFPDLFIMDKDLGAKEFCARSHATFVALAGLSRYGRDLDRYRWRETATLSVGKKKRRSAKGRSDAESNWSAYFDGR